MAEKDLYTLIAIAVISAITILLRFLPFIIFSGKKTPKIISYLGTALPCAMMGMLVIYCLKDVTFTSLSGFLPEIIAIIIVVAAYLLKRNTLISILSGTVSYMLLIQFVFPK